MTEEQLARLEKLAEATWKTINWDGPDAELIAAMRNALPELLQEIRELEQAEAERDAFAEENGKLKQRIERLVQGGTSLRSQLEQAEAERDSFKHQLDIRFEVYNGYKQRALNAEAQLAEVVVAMESIAWLVVDEEEDIADWKDKFGKAKDINAQALFAFRSAPSTQSLPSLKIPKSGSLSPRPSSPTFERKQKNA